jgi:hypothetical protein
MRKANATAETTPRRNILKLLSKVLSWRPAPQSNCKPFLACRLYPGDGGSTPADRRSAPRSSRTPGWARGSSVARSRQDLRLCPRIGVRGRLCRCLCQVARTGPRALFVEILRRREQAGGMSSSEKSREGCVLARTKTTLPAGNAPASPILVENSPRGQGPSLPGTVAKSARPPTTGCIMPAGSSPIVADWP